MMQVISRQRSRHYRRCSGRRRSGLQRASRRCFSHAQPARVLVPLRRTVSSFTARLKRLKVALPLPPPSSIAYGLQLSLHRPSLQQSHPETANRFFPDASPWFALTRSDHVDSRAGHRRRRRGLLDDTGLPPLLLSPSRRRWWRKGALGSPIDDRCQLGLAHGKDIGLRIKSKAHFLTSF